MRWLPVYLLSILISSATVTCVTNTCSDKSPYCNKNDCDTRPGYAIEYCKKTCGECKGFCKESQYVSCHISAKADCEFMLRDYCPIMCGLCRLKPSKYKNNSTQNSEAKLTSLSNTTQIFTNDGLSFLNNVAGTNNNTGAPFIFKSLNQATTQNLNYNENDQVVELSQSNETLTVGEPIANQLFADAEDLKIAKSSKPTRRMQAVSIFNGGKPLVGGKRPNFYGSSLLPIPTLHSVKNDILHLNVNTNRRAPIKPITSSPRRYPFMQGNTNYLLPMGQPVSPIFSGNHLPQTRSNSFQPSFVDYLDPTYFEATGPPLEILENTNESPVPIPIFSNTRPLSIQQAMAYETSKRKPIPTVPRLPQPPEARPIDYETIENREDSSIMESSLPQVEPINRVFVPSPVQIADLITLLGCHDKDPVVCSKVTEESCRARPGFYLKLCPVKCKNCNGLLCIDSNKIDCKNLQQRGGCYLKMAAEYCPKSCMKCSTPPFIMDQQSPCRDELDSCGQLAESGVCHHPLSRQTLRVYCAKSCGFCKESHYYMNNISDIESELGQKKLKKLSS